VEIKIEQTYFPNLGYMMVELPDFLLNTLRSKADDILKDPKSFDQQRYNDHLVGHIKQEYQITVDPDFTNFLEFLGKEYQQRFHMMPDRSLKLQDLWINLQRKHEFNPFHNHDGKLSFVIWVNIPYELDDELQVFAESRDNRTSKFEFMYLSALGHTCTLSLPVSKEWEGRLCMFPSSMLHSVNPFYTSDGVRVSVSGNLS